MPGLAHLTEGEPSPGTIHARKHAGAVALCGAPQGKLGRSRRGASAEDPAPRLAKAEDLNFPGAAIRRGNSVAKGSEGASSQCDTVREF
jgi:hypothetical protein